MPTPLVKYGAPSGGPPIICKNATLFGFFAQGTTAALQTLCNEVFTTTSGNAVKCEPLDDHVMVTVGNISWLGNDSSTVGVQEYQLVLQVPVDLTVGGVKKPAWFTPLTIVNNPLSLTGGREVFGFAKSYGKLTFPKDGIASSLAVKVFGANNTDQLARFRSLLSIRNTGAIVPQPGTNPLGLFNAIAGGLKPDYQTLLDSWMAAGVDQVFLKQFPDINSGADACLLQITKATFKFSPIPVVTPLLFNYELKVSQLDSHDITKDLGIANQTIAGGFRSDCSFTIDSGSVIWP